MFDSSTTSLLVSSDFTAYVSKSDFPGTHTQAVLSGWMEMGGFPSTSQAKV